MSLLKKSVRRAVESLQTPGGESTAMHFFRKWRREVGRLIFLSLMILEHDIIVRRRFHSITLCCNNALTQICINALN
ncbi:hypothetical protein SAMN05192532_103234 [Alteribacillus iranensis]|uniref:Uncharacterized protein n=1 Tax=Alteribacillus iranensis TaxID=930128 RepID=A0A1I2CVW6_9BACI|nr:hypothetical protein SAMN05192532_103234 [Alteribacillus iranensis]